MGLEGIATKIKGVKVAGLPIGDAALLLAGFGINDVIVPTVTTLTKLNIPIVVGPGVALLTQLGAVKKILGPTMANALAITAIMIGVDEQIGLRAKTRSLVSSLVGRVLPAPTAGAPAQPTASLGQAPVFVSEQERRTAATLRIR